MIPGTQAYGGGLPPRPTQTTGMEKVDGVLSAGVQGTTETTEKNKKIDKMVADYRASGAGETECAALKRALQNTSGQAPGSQARLPDKV